MGGPIFVVLSDVFMSKMELDIVAPAKPIFYKRYVYDTYVRKKKRNRKCNQRCQRAAYDGKKRFAVRRGARTRGSEKYTLRKINES